MSGHEPFLSLITYEKPAESTIFAIIWQKSMRHFTPKHPFDFKIRPVECPFHGTDRFQSRTESVATSRNAPKRRLLVSLFFEVLTVCHIAHNPSRLPRQRLPQPARPGSVKNVHNCKFPMPKRDNLGKKRIFADNQGEEACRTSVTARAGRAAPATDSHRGHENDSQPEV